MSGDALPADAVEEKGIPIGHVGLEKQTLDTDPHDADTDGDGLTDGQEVGPRVNKPVQVQVTRGPWQSVVVTYHTLESDPTTVDSVGDGLTDAEEREGWNATLATSAEQATRVVRATGGSGKRARTPRHGRPGGAVGTLRRHPDRTDRSQSLETG